MKDRAELQRYVRTRLELGDYTQSAAPMVRGQDRWTLLSDQHQQDRQHEKDLLTICGAHPFAATVLNPARNQMARVSVSPPQVEMELSQEPQPPQLPPAPSPRAIAEATKSRQKLDLQVCEAINSGQVQSYEQLVGACGSEEELRASLRRIRRFKGGGIAVQTIEGLVEFCPQVLVSRTMRYERTERASVQLLGMEDSRRGRVEVSLRIQRSAGSGGWLRERVCLDTVDNLRVVKILQAAQLAEISVDVLVGAEHDLHKGKMFTSLLGIEEEDALMEKLGELAQILERFC